MLKASINCRTKIPPDIFLQIFCYLDIKSINNCLSTCKTFYYIIEDRLWKILILRDYSHFLYIDPLSTEELQYPTRESDIQMIQANQLEHRVNHDNPFGDPLTEEEQNKINESISKITNFREFYKKCCSFPNLSGYWIGDYSGHGFELIKIYHKGYKAYGKKLTGDPNVPAGKLSWKMTFGEDMMEGKGFIHLAESGYNNPRWSTAYIEAYEKDLVKIIWYVQDHFGNWYSFTFANVKAGCKEFESEMNEKIDIITLDFDEEENY